MDRGTRALECKGEISDGDYGSVYCSIVYCGRTRIRSRSKARSGGDDSIKYENL